MITFVSNHQFLYEYRGKAVSRQLIGKINDKEPVSEDVLFVSERLPSTTTVCLVRLLNEIVDTM